MAGLKFWAAEGSEVKGLGVMGFRPGRLRASRVLTQGLSAETV